MAAEQDVPLPELRDTVLCGEDVLGDNASPVVHEASVWLSPAAGMERTKIEQILSTQMQLDEPERGKTTTAYKLPRPCEHDELVLEFDANEKLITHYFRTV